MGVFSLGFIVGRRMYMPRPVHSLGHCNRFHKQMNVLNMFFSYYAYARVYLLSLLLLLFGI